MSDTYEGWANRETWAFWLHVTNDQGWYEMVREYAYDLIANAEATDVAASDYPLGKAVVEYVQETLEELLGDHESPNAPGTAFSLNMMRNEIGSWWRIDYAEIGAAARELASDS